MRPCVIPFIASILLLLSFETIYANNRLGNLAASTSGMDHLLKLEEKLIDHLADYSNVLEQKLNKIQHGIRSMRIHLNESVITSEEYFNNPLHTFKIIRRLHMDWIKWESYMEESVGMEQITAIQELRKSLPVRGDIEFVVNALYRLQKIYDLNPLDIANGLLKGQQFRTTLSALDCFVIGSELLLFNPKNIYDSGDWLQAAIKVFKMAPSPDTFGITKYDLYALYTEILAKQQRWNELFIELNILMKEDPHDVRLLTRFYELQKMANLNLTSHTLQHVKEVPSPYMQGCRGEFPPKVSSNLHCLYNKTTHLFLQLAPLKMELLSVDPYVVLYHDVVSDIEIDEIKNQSLPLLERATVYDAKAKRNVQSTSRTAKVTWMYDKLSNITIRINQRIADMTGFNLIGSESLQIANYGLGGHYDLHVDYFDDYTLEKTEYMNGNRIATVLFYLSDVEIGGATTFPDLQLTVFPRKGAALIWYNLDNKMNGNPRTRHGACPVLVGSKWVCNKWIRANNQMTRKPCTD